jgi:hypothetical protein
VRNRWRLSSSHSSVARSSRTSHCRRRRRHYPSKVGHRLRDSAHRTPPRCTGSLGWNDELPSSAGVVRSPSPGWPARARFGDGVPMAQPITRRLQASRTTAAHQTGACARRRPRGP